MLWHWVDGSLKLFLDDDHILLVLLCYQVDGQSNLTISPTPPYPMQVGGGVLGEVEIYYHVHTGDIDPPRNQVGTDQGLKLPLPELLKDLDPFVLHGGSQVLVFEALAIEFFGEELGPLVGAAEDDTLVDDQLTIDFVEVVKLILLLDEDVVMGEADQH